MRPAPAGGYGATAFSRDFGADSGLGGQERQRGIHGSIMILVLVFRMRSRSASVPVCSCRR
jgi:hypothetical protein